MGLFDRMTFEEAYEVVTSLNPGKSELNKAEKTIGKMSTADKRVEPAVVLLCLHGKSRGTADAAFDVFRRVVTKHGFCEELRQVVNTEVFFQKFYDAYMGGSLKSAYMTALCFEKGWGTWRNHEKAVEIAGVLRERTDDADAQKVCEVVFGEENTKNPEEIYEQSEQLYKDGKLEESAALCEKAAELGHVQAMNATGYNYMYGDGVEPDVEKAAKWLRKAMAAGHAKAPINLARMGLYFGYEMDPEEIFTLLHTGVQKGISYAFAPLAECYYRGDGCPENQKLAVYWAQKAMEEKDSLGYALMGIFYNEGFYVPKVKSMAKHILLELKELDGTDIFGDLTEPIPEELEPAAPVLPVFDDAQPDFFTEECPYSQYIRGLQYLNGTDGEKDIPVDAAKGEELLTKAANQGLACAMQSLGIKYIDPHHREQVRYDEDGTVAGFAGNNELGLSLLRKAADLGDYEAIDCMIMLETEDIGITSEESRYYEELQEKLYQQSGAVSDEETNDTDVTEDAIEEVYEQEADTGDDEFESMTDYYKACLDEESSLYSDEYGDLNNAVKNIGPFFQAVINNFAEMDPGTAQEFLAEIVQVDASALNKATSDDGIFSGEEVNLFDICECALKCAYNECLANPNELTETAMLHFAYYLYNEYSTLNERSPSDLFRYYIDYYIQTYGVGENTMWDVGALYFARIFVNDQQYSAIPEGEVYYELEEIYGEALDELFKQEDIFISPNIQGRLYDANTGFVASEDEEEEIPEPETTGRKETENGDVYEGGLLDDEYHGHGKYTSRKGWVYEGEFRFGKITGRGKTVFANGKTYEGEWLDGKRHGYGEETFTNGNRYVGEHQYDKLCGQGTMYLANGDIYEGAFADDSYHGYGVYKELLDGRKKYLCSEGDWEEDKRVGWHDVYYIEIATGNKEFKDTTYYVDGKRYEQPDDPYLSRDAIISRAKRNGTMFTKWRSVDSNKFDESVACIVDGDLVDLSSQIFKSVTDTAVMYHTMVGMPNSPDYEYLHLIHVLPAAIKEYGFAVQELYSYLDFSYYPAKEMVKNRLFAYQDGKFIKKEAYRDADDNSCGYYCYFEADAWRGATIKDCPSIPDSRWRYIDIGI